MSLIIAYMLYRVRRSDVGSILIMMALLTSFWLMMIGLSYFTENSQTIIFFQKVKYISIALIPVLSVITAFALTWKLSLKNFKWLSFLFVIPILTLLSLMTNTIPYPFMSNVDVFLENGVPQFIYDKQFGYHIHTVYSYSLMVISSLLLLYRVIKVPKMYKIQSIFIFTGVTGSTILNVLYVLSLYTELKVDSTPFSILIALIIYYWGIYNLPLREIIPHARNLVIENMSDLVIIVDNQGMIIDVNPPAYQLFSSTSSLFQNGSNRKTDFRGMSFVQLVGSLPIINSDELDAQATNPQLIDIKTDDKIFHYREEHAIIYDADSSSVGILYIVHDITEIQSHINELLKLNRELNISEIIIRDALEGIFVTDSNNNIIKVNKSMEVMTGYSRQELIGNNPSLFKSSRHDSTFYKNMWDSILEKGFWEGEIWDKHKNGDIYPTWMSITVIKDEHDVISHFICISSNISKIKKAEKEMYRMTYYDSLTSLPNRALFSDRLELALERCKRHNKKLALLYMNLSHFKLVNDTYGYGVGDALLIAFSNRIKQHIRKTDTFCRLGGNEFALIIEDLENGKHASVIAQTLINKAENGFTIHNNDITIPVSIGIAIGPDDDDTIDGLLRKSNAAMHLAKEVGDNMYSFSSVELENHNKELYQLQVKLKKAIKNHEFELYLQPQIGMIDHQLTLTGAEALIRWPQKDGTMIPPLKFIDIAEKNGLIHPIGLWVLEEIISINQTLIKENIHIDLAINVSIRQFENDHFYTKLKKKIQDDIRLSVEITESLFFNDFEEAIEKLKQIKDLGVKIALDDFGTGFSSMSYLNRLPIDYLKIDKSFTDQLKPDSNKNLAFMILSMAKTLELKTIAEGIETQEHAAILFNEGCDIIQGYYYGKPMPVSEFIKFAKNF